MQREAGHSTIQCLNSKCLRHPQRNPTYEKSRMNNTPRDQTSWTDLQYPTKRQEIVGRKDVLPLEHWGKRCVPVMIWRKGL